MSQAADHSLEHLPPAAARLGAAFARPKLLAVACVVALATLGWLYLALLIAGMGGPASALGPGMGALDLLPRTIRALCSPTFGLSVFAMPGGAWGAGGFALVALMWGAMALAMMLPSAAPMILTYAEIADTAARKGEAIITPFALAAGYTVIWLGFALARDARAIRADARGADRCRHGLGQRTIFGCDLHSGRRLPVLRAQGRLPAAMPESVSIFLYALGRRRARGVFRLGIRQGLYCLGCCWAMMAVMFAVGVMNVIWMAALGIVMTLEKVGSGRRFTYGVGAALDRRSASPLCCRRSPRIGRRA